MRESRRFPNSFRVASSIARVTFLEVIRDKLLYNTLGFTTILFFVGILASKLVISVSPERVILDFGLSAIRLGSVAIGVLVGANLLGREIERKTIQVALSHPITRVQFVVGKFIGIVFVLLVNWLLTLLGYFLLLYSFNDGSFYFSSTFFFAVIFAYLEGLVMASLAVFFSSFTTSSLSVIFSVGAYLIGQNASQIQTIVDRMAQTFSSQIARFLVGLLPNLENFNLGSQVTYQLPVSLALVGYGFLYGGTLIALSVLLAGLILSLRKI